MPRLPSARSLKISSHTLPRPIHLTQVRRESQQTLPFARPPSIESTANALPQDATTDGELRGWIRSSRTVKNARFFDIIDGSTFSPVQAIVPRSATRDGELDRLGESMRVGSAVHVQGRFKASRGPGRAHESSPNRDEPPRRQPFDLEVLGGRVLGESESGSFPIQSKYQTPQFLRTIPHLRPRAPVQAAVLRLRSKITNALGGFFESRDFVQTHPPIITSSDCEGAGEVFSPQTTTTTTTTTPYGTKDQFFYQRKFLTVSSQLHLEALAQSMGAVWTLSPVFRAEHSDTGRHLSEFYMLEAEVAFVESLGGIMDLVEDMLTSMARMAWDTEVAKSWIGKAHGHEGRWWGTEKEADAVLAGDIATRQEAEKRWLGLKQDRRRWPRITYSEAIDILSPHKSLFKHKPTWGAPLQTEHEKFLARKVGCQDSSGIHGHLPVFVTHYPQGLKPFYMTESTPSSTAPTPGPTVECFDLLVPKIGELAGGSMREHRHDHLEASMERCGIKRGSSTDWYLDLRRWGCPPHGGFGLGFDRLLAYLTTMPNVRDMAPFPRWPGRCDC